MIGWFKDLPDYCVGAVAAVGLWYGAVYVVLAPRAMERHFETEVFPPCLERLEAEQETALANARDRFERQRENAARALRAQEMQLRQYDNITGLYRQSGLTDMLSAFGVPSIEESVGVEAQSLRRDVERTRAALSVEADFDSFRVPRDGLLATCSCAALQAAAGKRSTYALSLASFRLIEPADITEIKSSVVEITGTNVCGAQPWRNL